MNKKSLVRKIVYIITIVVLLLPLFALGQPRNGLIGNLRTKYRMGQADLGKLDPTSESMRLATLGLKGIAATILWLRADWYKEEKYFDRFSATLNQISKLQPHFIKVWDFQAHNLGYNVAPEFDDYRQRYEWIKKGVDYLVRGTKFNERKPMLQFVLGNQYFGSKLGKADEKVQYRQIYRNDVEFHDYLKDQGLVGIDTDARGQDQKPDTWLTGRLWLDQATSLYEAGAPIQKSPHLLYSYSPNWIMYYAEAIESEGVLDASAALAWKQGGEKWAQFGTKSLYQLKQGRDLTLLSQRDVSNEISDLEKQIEEIAAEAKATAVANLRKTLSPEELAIYDKPMNQLTPDEMVAFNAVALRLIPNPQQIAVHMPQSKQVETLRISNKLIEAQEFLQLINSYRQQVNYDYWEMRSNVEQRDEMIKARKLTYDADKLIDDANVLGALELYEKARVYWDWIFRRFPTLMTEESGDDVYKSIGRYRKLKDEDLDDNFILSDFMRYRRLNNNEMNTMEAEEMMRQWRQIAPTLGDDPPKFNDEPKSLDSPNPAKGTQTNGASSENSKADEPPPTPPKEDASAIGPQQRPPTLENPDSQN